MRDAWKHGKLRVLDVIVAAAVTLSTASSQASVQIYGGPTYDAATRTGYIATSHHQSRAISQSVGIGAAGRYLNSTVAIDQRAFRVGSNGFVELAHLSVGTKFSRAHGINASGTIVGWSSAYSDGISETRPVRWDAGGTLATELDTLSYPGGMFAGAYALAINSSGVVVGGTNVVAPGTWGSHAARWDSAAAEITELGSLGYRSDGYANASAQAVNDAGTGVGSEESMSTEFSGAKRRFVGMPPAPQQSNSTALAWMIKASAMERPATSTLAGRLLVFRLDMSEAVEAEQ